jgi:hypothetical protein
MALDASLDAALKGAAPLVCLLVRVDLPEHTIRVVDGAGEVVFDSAVWRGEDSIYGVLDSIDTLSEQVGTEAPMVRLTFLPADLAALANLTDPTNQGSEVHVWLGAVDPASGAIIGAPELLFFGVLDAADAEVSTERTVIMLDVASAWERLFETNEGQRLNNAFIQSIYPGALGASYVISIQRDLPWGYDAPRPAVVSDVIGGNPVPGTSPIPGGGFGGGGVGGFFDFLFR